MMTRSDFRFINLEFDCEHYYWTEFDTIWAEALIKRKKDDELFGSFNSCKINV